MHVLPSPLGFKCPAVEWNMPWQGGWIKSWLCCFLRCDLILSKVSWYKVWSLELSCLGPVPALLSSDFISLLQFSHVQNGDDNSTTSGADVRVKYLITCSALRTGPNTGQCPITGGGCLPFALAAPCAWKALPHWARSVTPLGLYSSSPCQWDLTWLHY